ncbi:MAG: hypothetical protein DMF66_14385 [Acidobacteria bacterium]|nr:MAG: hypothetical protein DMF66_14385 [Acidobacteriota bacterium]
MALKSKPFSEQVALVTGGGTGIGRAFAGALASAGARVVIASRNEATLQSTADELNSAAGAERVFAYAFDVRDRGQCEAVVRHCVERFGALDVLVNNSGLAVPETVEEITEEGWDKVLETNLKGAMRLVRAALPVMAAQEFGEARLRRRSVLLRLEVGPARLRRVSARPRAQIGREHPCLQLLPRPR